MLKKPSDQLSSRLLSSQVGDSAPIELQRSVCWLEQAVIGLNFCPFAGLVHQQSRLLLVLTQTDDPVQLLNQLDRELSFLSNSENNEIESVLLIHPAVLNEFDDYLDFLEVTDSHLVERSLDGEIQIASFHPDYLFGGEAPDAIGHNTNRSPFPMLHLLREHSVSQAVDHHPDTESIGDSNRERLENMGFEQWDALARQWTNPQ